LSSAQAVCLSLAGAAALLAVVWSAGARALRAGAWFGAACIGQAISLQLIAAGPSVGYQHYRPVAALAADYPGHVLFLAALAIALTLSSRRLFRAMRGWAGPISRGMWLIIGIGALAIAATISRHPATYLVELTVAGAIQLIALGTVAMAVLSLPDNLSERLGFALDRLLAASPRFVLVLALGVVVLASALAIWSYQRHPHVPDEVAYLFQARYFAEGMLTLPAPPVAAGFSLDLVQIDSTRWFSIFPPGWPALLALGVLAGVPWLVNPLLAGLNVLLCFSLFRRVYDRRTATLATALFAFSPWHLFMAMSYMSHTMSLTLALAAAVAISAARRERRALPAVLAGLAVGVIGLTRPLEGVVVGLLLGLAVIGLRGRAFRVSPAAGLALGTAITGGLGLWYNHRLTGGMFSFPVEAYFAREYGPGHYEIGFGPTRGLGWTGLDPLPGHGPADILINANLNAFAANVELFGWWMGSVLVVLVGAVAGWRHPVNRIMLAAIGSIVLAQSFYWFSGGPDFGARYWFLIIVPCVALAAAGIERLGTSNHAGPEDGPRSGRIHLAVAASCLMALITFGPWRATDKYFHYRGMRPEVRAVAQDPRLKGALVLVRGARHPDYASAAVYNPLELSGHAPVFAWDRDPATRQALLAAFPDRPVWILNGPTVTGTGYQLSAGPLRGDSQR